MLNEYQRLHLVNLAIENFEKFRSSNIEYNLPKPTYTIDSLIYLKEKYPSKQFVLMIGADNVISFDKWKNYREITRQFEIYVYPRPESDLKDISSKYPSFNIVNAPKIDISSRFIRNSIKEKKNVRFFLPDKVYNYILEMHFYQK